MDFGVNKGRSKKGRDKEKKREKDAEGWRWRGGERREEERRGQCGAV